MIFAEKEEGGGAIGGGRGGAVEALTIGRGEGANQAGRLVPRKGHARPGPNESVPARAPLQASSGVGCALEWGCTHRDRERERASGHNLPYLRAAACATRHTEQGLFRSLLCSAPPLCRRRRGQLRMRSLFCPVSVSVSVQLWPRPIAAPASATMQLLTYVCRSLRASPRLPPRASYGSRQVSSATAALLRPPALGVPSSLAPSSLPRLSPLTGSKLFRTLTAVSSPDDRTAAEFVSAARSIHLPLSPAIADSRLTVPGTRMSSTQASENPFSNLVTDLPKAGGGSYGKYYSLVKLNDPRIDKLPYSIRYLLESAIRNCDNFQVLKDDVEKILDWEKTAPKQVEIPFKPARVILQDFTGVPAVVDLAAMRDAITRLGGDPDKINPLVPVDLVIDHSVQVDVARSANALQSNMELEFSRNKERFGFLKWGAKAFKNMLVVPPGSGIVHQVNLEYLARVVFNSDGILYPDTLVGTDSHTTMIDGLGVAGWGVGGIEAEAAMLGQPMSMVLPGVVGFKLNGKLRTGVTATDLVLTVTQVLRKMGVVGKFVEFYGKGMSELTLADRATIANMSPEYGATMGFFPVDRVTLDYLRMTGRDEKKVEEIEAYLRANNLFVDHEQPQKDNTYSAYLELDLDTVEPCISGPKRPHDRVMIKDMKQDWQDCLDNKVGFKGFAIPKEQQDKVVKFTFEGKPAEMRHGSVVIAAITSCTNTSNPSVMLGAGLVAKKATELGLEVKPWVKTSLAPGSGVVTKYLEKSGLDKYLDKQGFSLVGYGCTTCIGNSGDLHEDVAEAIAANDMVASAVLSGNRNFEGRVHPLTRANYLASPPLVVAYAFAGTVNIDFEKEPIGLGKDGKKVFLRDIWPSSEEVAEVVASAVLPEMFQSTYKAITEGNTMWNSLEAPAGAQYEWDPKSTYVHDPPFFKTMTKDPPGVRSVKDAFCLLNFGDSITTDHISPAGNINKESPAAKYLMERGVDRRDFNSYGSRRGNDEIMARGTFANIRIVNKFLKGEVGPKTLHVPTQEKMFIYDAAVKYKDEGHDTIILAGAEYGSGSSRDWAAKGPYLQGVKAVIAKSFERIHRSNLVGMGLIPLCFKEGEDADTLGLTGFERYTIDMPALEDIKPGMDITVKTDSDKEFTCVLRFDTQVELTYFSHGGILQYVLRQLLNK